LGTRLRSVLADRPKALAPIGERPFVDIQINMLRDQVARRFVVCMGHRGAQIRETLGDGTRLGVQIDYSIEAETLLGTGGAVRLAERFIVDQIPSGLTCSLERDVFPGTLTAGRRLAAFLSDQPFFDIGTPGDFQQFLGRSRQWSQGRRGTDSSQRARSPGHAPGGV
jgi:NDP-sugar pyrophosphorylase family protein